MLHTNKRYISRSEGDIVKHMIDHGFWHEIDLGSNPALQLMGKFPYHPKAQFSHLKN